jgi:2-polyprenyl-6-hydroxyphenyl methylase/3-demethylubiquinone-9 3-methyltransferase
MKTLEEISGYTYGDDACNSSHGYLMPALVSELAAFFAGRAEGGRRVFDLGCGHGSVAAALAARGYDVTGVDPSREGIEQSRTSHPELKLYTGSAYDDLRSQYGEFPAVYSLEVVEHVYAPREYAATLFSLVAPGGVAIVSTPYHGYLKNLVLAATASMDKHFTALWDHGHIKFWSMATLSTLLREAGFGAIRFRRVGRVPALAKSMIAIARKA